MFRLRFGYLLSGIITGFLLISQFLASLPDGKLHITFCSVGQGDAAYIKFPDGRDMLIDGGPGNTVLGCLGRVMPFWDRTIDMVILTHPEKDHLAGLIPVLSRYRAGYMVRSDIENKTELFAAFQKIVREKQISEKLVTSGEMVRIGPVIIRVLAPSPIEIASKKNRLVLGASTGGVNEYSVVLLLQYGSFDALFTGDATLRQGFEWQATDPIEVLKVPHHGSKTGMNPAFLDWLSPLIAVISVGKNSYGHPTPEILEMLHDKQVNVLRTDHDGDITIISDGTNWVIE